MKISAARIPARPLLAILPPLLAFLLQWTFWSSIQPYAWSSFYPAICISAWIGGRRAGLRATAISVALVWWFFVPPFFPLQEGSLGTAFSTLAFVTTATLISLATNRLRQAKQRLSIAAAEAKAASAQLSDAEGEIAQMQQQTEALDKYHAMLLSKVSDAVFAADRNFLITYWNPAAERIYGWSAAEAIGHSAAELMHSIFPGTSREEVLQTLRRTGQFQGELHQFTKDGRKLTLLGNTAALYDASGEFAGYVTVNHDITEKMRQEEELKEHVRRFSDLYNQAPCGYHSLDKHGRFIEINDTELGWLGYQRDEVLGKLALQDLLTRASAAVPSAKSGGNQDALFQTAG